RALVHAAAVIVAAAERSNVRALIKERLPDLERARGERVAVLVPAAVLDLECVDLRGEHVVVVPAAADAERAEIQRGVVHAEERTLRMKLIGGLARGAAVQAQAMIDVV